MLRWTALAVGLLALAACASDSSKIQGNETGGIVPAIVRGEADAAAAAAEHCRQYNRTARVTAKGADAGGATVFVCLAPGKQSPFER